ncbi:MAG: Flp family type IVb pilin [Bosea sp. (in: a-proteobacteria)]
MDTKCDEAGMKRQNGEIGLQAGSSVAADEGNAVPQERSKRPCASFAAFSADEHGTTALEYCFIAFLISIIAIIAMTQIGAQTLINTASIIPGLAR